MIIRKALAADIDAICQLRKRAILAQCADFYSEKQLALWTQGEVSPTIKQDIIDAFYVAEIDQLVVGCGMLTVKKAMLDAIFVDPDYFGQGIATQMVTFLEQQAKEHGLSHLTLEATLNAAAFYRTCGFVGDNIATYQSPRGISLACVPMQKQLN
ncbi:GNAT family N-acetyltransferase [Shewanella waksmanii]|uniref:GNAT family N-acetyltransferase n=1 Tax=Shewanella waksmanii TaxID=213783 RepID=UPI003734FD41